LFASASRRVAAYVIDAVLLTAILYGAFIVFGAVVGPPIEFHADITDFKVVLDVGRAQLAALMSAVISLAYFAGSWVLLPATPGQRLLGLRTSRAADARPLSAGQATLRWVLLLGPLYLSEVFGYPYPEMRAPLFLLVVLWYVVLFASTLLSPTRQGLHDRWSGSAVLNTQRQPA